jgi:GDP-L-fucose synthase
VKVLVTGATGFLGRFLCRDLEGRGDSVVRLGSKECDLTRDGSLEPWSGERFDRIYHLAAWTQAGDFCLYHPGEQWVINQRINTNVLDWWQRSQPQAKLVAMGSSCSYDPDLELVEENYLAGIPIDSLYTYAMTKRMLHVGLLALHRQFGMRYLTLVPSTLYGSGYHTDGRQMHFIFDLIRKILRGKLHEESVVLWGDGHQKRELVYVDDFVRVMIELSDSRENDLINIGGGEEFSIRHFARLICEQVGYDFKSIVFDETRYVGARSKCLSVRKLRSLLPEATLTPVEEGLERTVAWFLENREALLFS